MDWLHKHQTLCTEGVTAETTGHYYKCIAERCIASRTDVERCDKHIENDFTFHVAAHLNSLTQTNVQFSRDTTKF